MHSRPATIPPAPSPSTQAKAKAEAASPGSFVEDYIGVRVAAAASALLAALDEFKDGGLTSRTKTFGGSTIVELFELHQFLQPQWDFNALARAHGVAALRAACGDELSPASAAALVEEVLSILDRVIRGSWQ